MTKKHNVWALIPARSGSKGIRHKNLQKILGISLLEWAIFCAKDTKIFDRIIISTDSNKYAKLAESYEAEAILRPKNISGDKATDLEWIKHVLFREDVVPYAFAIFRPTTPLRSVKIIRRAWKQFLFTGCTSLRSIESIEPVEKIFNLEDGDLISATMNSMAIDMDDANAPRQGMTPCFKANGYFEFCRTKNVMENNNVYGYKVNGFITPKTIEIDDKQDLEMARAIAEVGKW